MNKKQMKKLNQIKKRGIKDMRLAVEVAFVRRAKAMPFRDRLALAWLIIKGGA